MLDVDFTRGVHAKLPRLPVEIGSHDLSLRGQPPAIGEHSAEILSELGLAQSEIDALSQRGIVAVKPRTEPERTTA